MGEIGSLIGDFLWLGVAIIIFLVIGAILYAFNGNTNPLNYSYVTEDGEEGYANWCSSNKQLVCHTDDRTIIVKEYTKNKEK